MRNDITSADYLDQDAARYEQARELANAYLQEHRMISYDALDERVESFYTMLLATEDCH